MKTKTRPPTRHLPPPTREQIAALAYAIWQDRGCPAGSDLDIWLDAERVLQGDTAVRHTIAGDIPADPANPDRDPAIEGTEVDEALDAVVSSPQRRSPTSL